MIRRILSASLFALVALLLYTLFGAGAELLITLVPAAMALLRDWMGYVFLMALGVLMVYESLGGLVGLLVLALAIDYVESVYMAEREAPMEHYYILFAGTLMALPVFYMAYALSFYLPSLVNTAVAAVFIILLYVLFYVVVKH